MGLDISEELCVAIMHDVLGRAQAYDTFVRLDMESSAYTERTLQLFYDRLYPAYKDNVGIVLQSYLYRTWSDVERADRRRVAACASARARTRSRRPSPSRTRRKSMRIT